MKDVLDEVILPFATAASVVLTLVLLWSFV